MKIMHFACGCMITRSMFDKTIYEVAACSYHATLPEVELGLQVAASVLQDTVRKDPGPRARAKSEQSHEDIA